MAELGHFERLSTDGIAETEAVETYQLDQGSHSSTVASYNIDEDTPSTQPTFVFQGIPEGETNEQGPYFVRKHGLAVVVPQVTRRWEYAAYDEPVVDEILEELVNEDEVTYLVRFNDETQEIVSIFSIYLGFTSPALLDLLFTINSTYNPSFTITPGNLYMAYRSILFPTLYSPSLHLLSFWPLIRCLHHSHYAEACAACKSKQCSFLPGLLRRAASN